MSDLAQPFMDMAERIIRNKEEGFGGAFVISPPSSENEPAEALVLLMLDNSKNPAQFWATLQTTAAMALQKLADQERQGPYGRLG